MNYFTALVILVAITTAIVGITDYNDNMDKLDDTIIRIEKIERYLDIEFINVYITGDIIGMNNRIDKWHRQNELSVYYNNYDEYINSKDKD